MSEVTLLQGDCLDVLPTLEAESVDSVITDPPYGLEFMGKEWDKLGRKKALRGKTSGLPCGPGTGRGTNPVAGKPGFDLSLEAQKAMQDWHYRWAKACLRVAKPGAMLLAFGGTRTHHRLMCAIEDAGWEIRDCLMWIYGSGFPKSHDISKAIDKAAGAEREVVGARISADGRCRTLEPSGQQPRSPLHNGGIRTREEWETAPSTSAAAQLWDGWGTALKPAWEPIILAMKPREGTFAQNALEYGVAGLWVDGTRVATNGEDAERHQAEWDREWIERGGRIYGKDKGSRNGNNAHLGRWPANLCLSHHPECVRVGEKRVKGTPGTITGYRNGGHHMFEGGWKGTKHAPDGYASPDGYETVEDWQCHPECPVRLLDEQSGESKSNVRPPIGRDDRGVPGFTMRRLDSQSRGHNDNGGASRFFTRFHYCPKASRSERTCNGEIENKHPTVKPLDLCRWLCRLTKTPTGGVVLDPFMGSGSIPVASILEGRDVIGIELEHESFETARARIAWAQEQVPAAIQAQMAL